MARYYHKNTPVSSSDSANFHAPANLQSAEHENHHELHHHVHIPMEIQFLAGAIAGLLSWGLVYPIDVLKTEMQSLHASSPNSTGTLMSTTNCLRKYWQPQNRHLLVKGISPCLAGSIPACGMTFLVYESLVALANKKLYGI